MIGRQYGLTRIFCESGALDSVEFQIQERKMIRCGGGGCEAVDEKAFFSLRGSSSLVKIQYGSRVMPNIHSGAISHDSYR
jgi:hypothetical protein